MAINNKPSAPAGAGGVGLGLDSFTEGGGLYDDFDGEILECAFVPFDYNGTVDPPVLALAVEIRNLEIEDDPTTVEGGGTKNPFVQYYSAGDMKNFVPSADTKEAVPVGSKTGLSKSTNAYAFIASLIKGGFDATKIGKRVDVFEGTKCHFKREKQEERSFKKKPVAEGKRDKEVLLVERVLDGTAGTTPKGPATAAGPRQVGVAGPRPGPVAARPGPASPKPAPAPAPSPAATTSAIDPAAAELAQTYILEVLAATTYGTHPKVGLGAGVVAWAKPQSLAIPLRNKVIQLMGNDEFLGNQENGWSFDGETLTLLT